MNIRAIEDKSNKKKEPVYLTENDTVKIGDILHISTNLISSKTNKSVDSLFIVGVIKNYAALFDININKGFRLNMGYRSDNDILLEKEIFIKDLLLTDNLNFDIDSFKIRKVKIKIDYEYI